MDNACHTLCGLALARAGLDRLGPRTVLATVLAANAPDADAISLLFGKAAYLVHHRGITHSLALLLPQALLIAGLLRWWPRRRTAAAPRFVPLLLAAVAGIASHLALDALNSYGIRPWLPFTERWIYLDVAFIVDPWLWLLLAAGAALGTAKDRRTQKAWTDWAWADWAWADWAWADWAWIAWSVVATAFLAANARVAAWVPIAFGSGMLLLLAARRRVLRLPHARSGAWLGLALAGAYVTALAALGTVAERRAAAALADAGWPVERLVARARIPAPAHPFVYEVVAATVHDVRVVRVDLLDGGTRVGPPLPRNLDARLLERLRLSRELRAWRVFARIPIVRRDGSELRLGDARFLAPGRDDDWSALVVPLPR